MTNPKYEVVGKRIKSRMIDHGLRHKDLVEKIGVSKGTVTHWINGTSVPTTERLEKLCKLLDIDKSELIAGVFDQNNGANSLLQNNKLLNSFTVKVPYFRRIIDCFNYINIANELDPMPDENVVKNWETVEIPKAVLEESGVDEGNALILKKTSKFLKGYEGDLDLFLDKSVTKAVTNGHYLINFGDLKDIRELTVHPVTGEIKILDLDGTGKLPPTPVSDFNFELIVLAKAFYAGISLN